MPEKTGIIVLIKKKGGEPDAKFDALVEQLRRMGRDVLVIEADNSIFQKRELTNEEIGGILRELNCSMKKRLN